MGAQAKQSDDMSRHRAILTDRERELIANAADDEKGYQYQAVSRIRNKIHDELTEDVELLEGHHPDLLEELRDVVWKERGEDE